MADETIPIKRPVVNIPDFVAQAQSDASRKEDVKYPTETIPLPTKGWFYPEGHPLSSGQIELKQMTAKEEDILANQDLIKKGKVLDKLLESVIVNKAIRQEEILVPDKNAIFISIRRLAYGDEYPVNVTCPNCGQITKVSINLSNMSSKEFDFSKYTKGENCFTFRMPDCGKTVTYKLLNQIDEQSIDAELANLKKMSKEASGDLTIRLKYVITSVDGNPDKALIRKFVDTLKAKDSLAFRRHLRDNNPDIDRVFDFKCDNCSLERRMDMPIEASFLWPDLES